MVLICKGNRTEIKSKNATEKEESEKKERRGKDREGIK